MLMLLLLLLLLLLLMLLLLVLQRKREALKGTNVELLHGRDRDGAAERELARLESTITLISVAPLSPRELHGRKRLLRRRR